MTVTFHDLKQFENPQNGRALSSQLPLLIYLLRSVFATGSSLSFAAKRDPNSPSVLAALSGLSNAARLMARHRIWSPSRTCPLTLGRDAFLPVVNKPRSQAASVCPLSESKTLSRSS